MKYYITSIGYNVLYQELEETLCQYENKVEWRQPYIDRAWDEILFKTELEALTKLRELYPDKTLTLFEDTGKIVSTDGNESGLTSMVIRKEKVY